MKKLALGLLKSADEKLKSFSKGQGSRPTNQVSPAAAGPAIETPERLGRRETVNTDQQSKARHRSRSEGPRRGERQQRILEKNDSQGPQWAVSHEPRRSPRPLCLRQFSDDDIPEVNQSGSDTDSGDSGPKRWTRNPLLIKKTKKVEKTRATDWKKTVPVDENKSQTMPTSIGRSDFDSPSSTRQSQVIPNTWSNPDRLSSTSPKGKFQRLEEMRQQRMEVYPTSDEEGNPHSEISNQIRQRLSQVQAGRGKGRKSSLGEYDGVDNKSGPEYTNYLKNAGDQIILEPKLKSEVPKPAPMTASFPSYRPMSTAFTGGSGSLSPTVTSKRDSMTPSHPEKPAKPRMVVVEYPRKNQQNGGISNIFKLDPKYDANSAAFSANLRSEGRGQAAHNPNRNSTAIAFGNSIQCIIPSQQQSTQQQPPLLPPRQHSVQSQSPLLQPHRFLTQQQTLLQPQQEPSQPQPQHLLLQQSLQQKKQEPLLMQQQQSTFLQQPSVQQQQSTFVQQPSVQQQQSTFLQQPSVQQQQSTFLQQPSVQQRQSFLQQQHEQQLLQLQLEHQQQLQQMQLGQQHQQLPLPSQHLFVQPDNVESTNSHIKPFGTSSPRSPYRPVSFQPLHQAENGLDRCPPPAEFKTPEKKEPKPHKSKPSGSQKRHSRAEPISIGATNSDGGMLLHVPARHISKCYSDGDSLDELLESNMPYLESSSEINTLQLHRHSLKVIEDSLNGTTTTTTTMTDTISVTSQPATLSNQPPDVLRPTPIIPDVRPQQATLSASVPVVPVPRMPVPQAPTPGLASKMPDVNSPLVTGLSRLHTSTSNFSKETKPTAAYPPTKPFEVSELGFIDYKPIITISESLLVSESNKTKRSIDVDRNPANDNRLSSSSTPSTLSSQTLNPSPQPGLCVPVKDAGMFSDVEYDIEVSERVKKWEKYMKTPIKNAPIEVKPTDVTGDNHLATTVKDMANEWSKYLSVIEEDSPATKPYSADPPSKPPSKPPALDTPIKNPLEAQRKVNLSQKNPTQTGSISDSDMYKGKSLYIPSLGPTKSLLQVTPIQDTSSLALSRSYHEGAPNKSSSLDSPLFIPARHFSNSSPASDVAVPVHSPVANKEYELFSPQTRSTSSLHSTDSKMAASRSDQPTPDLFEITKMTENILRRKSDTQAIRVSNQLSPRSTAISDQCSWKNLIGDMHGKLKDTEIWSPQMHSHQGPVSIERVTARTLETIPFSEDPFWKEIEELTNFDQLMKDLPSDPKSPPPPLTSRSKFFPPPDSTTTSCYQVSMVSSQPSHNYSLSSLLSSLTEDTAPTKSYSTSNLKTSFKSEGMNALDEVLLDLQPVLGNKLTTNRRYGSSTDMSNTSSPRRPVSYHSSNYTTNRTDAQNSQGLKTMVGSTTEVKDSPTFSKHLQETTHSNMTYQSMTNLGEKQYENVVNGNYQLDPSILKEKLISTGLVERSPSGEDLALLMKNSKSRSSNILVVVKDPEKPVVQPPVEENIEELKILARQVEDKLSEIKAKILKADDNNLDKILTTLKTFSPSTSAMLSANVQTPTKVASRESFIARKAKLNDAISELENIYDKLNLGSEVYLEHAKSAEFPSSLTGQESHGFRLSSSFSQLYESSQSHQSSSDTFHSDIRFLSSSDHGPTRNRHYGELPQVPVKDVGSEYPVKIGTSALRMRSKMEDASRDSVVSSNNEVPTRRSRTRRQRRAAMVNESNQEGRKARSSVNKDDNDAPRAYITSVTVERSPRSKSSVRADGMDGGSSRQANGSRRPKPPPRSSSLHRKPGRDEERSRRKSTPPDFDLKQGNNDALSQSSNSHTEPAEESRLMPKMMHHLQQQRQELSCSSDSSAETIQQKKRAVSKSIAKMVDLFSSSDEERHKKSRVRPKPEQPSMSEICEDTAEKVSDDSRSSKSCPKSQPSGKIMTPRSVKQRHDAKRQKAALAQQTTNDTCSAILSDETPATEDSSAASKPPLPLRRQRSQSSEKCVSSSEENAADECAKSETLNESSQFERNPKEKSSPTASNASRNNRWSISSARELLNASDSSVSSEHASAPGKVVIDRAERCRSFHELFASFEPDQKRIEKLRRLQKSASEEGAVEECTMRTFHSEPDLRHGRCQINETPGTSSFHLTITVND